MIKNWDSAANRKKIQNYSYCLSHNIGKGYSSQVFKGRNDDTDQVVAIKVIDMKKLKGQVHKNLLQSQIDVLNSLKNIKNIINVFGVFTTKNNTYIVTQYCEGGDLSKVISSKRGLNEKDAINYLKQIVSGYYQLSSKKIIHRDLKPANILLKESKIKIADFGFAMKSSDSKKYSSYNVGSPIYMPPEALNQNKYSLKSDIWALGIIFFELLTGRTPWRAKTQKQLGRQLTSIPISKLIPPNISQVSAQFLQKTLTVNYDRRMNPQQLQRFMSKFDSYTINTNYIKTCNSFSTNNTTTTRVNGTQCSIRGTNDENQIGRRQQTSLTKNTINQPKNMRRFTLLKSQNQQAHYTTLGDIKNASLPKTASSMNGNIRTQKTLQSQSNRKKVSKQLLSQIHFCRFVYKLLIRIQNKLNGKISQSVKNSMCGVIFQKLEDVTQLTCLLSGAFQYKKSNDYKKICQIVNQYQQKYQKQLKNIQPNWRGFDFFEVQLSNQIKKIFYQIDPQNLQQSQQKVIILDYLITLRQLSNLLSKRDLQLFHNKSKIEAIVQGSPARSITHQHLDAITSKLKAIKLI